MPYTCQHNHSSSQHHLLQHSASFCQICLIHPRKYLRSFVASLRSWNWYSCVYILRNFISCCNFSTITKEAMQHSKCITKLTGIGSLLVSSLPHPLHVSLFWWIFFRETNPNWADEIRDDVLEECNKHGGVLHVFVDRQSAQGNVYVKCPTIATAAASVNALHGRWFAGKETACLLFLLISLSTALSLCEITSLFS